ncbi:MAG: glycosyltransferase family 4 protein [Cyclobacteriaceae bacterium]|jgi:glycosyltransferase involved in cell wall biosynthesis
MKVAIVLNSAWNIYNFRMSLVKALQAEGHEVHTVAPFDQFSAILAREGCINHDVKMDSRGANPLKDFGLFFELFFIYKKIKPDVVLHYTIKPNIYGTLAAAALRIPTINNVCGLGTIFLKDNFVSSVAIKMYKFAFRFPKKVFFQNPDDRTLFIDRKLIRSEVTDLVPGSGIDLKKFAAVQFNRNRPFTFLLISRLITDKGVMEFVDAVKKLKSSGLNAHFQILGAKDPAHQRGIPIATINQWVESKTVEYLGTTKDVRAFISKADCIVLPSYREGTPRTLLEAASSAKPIITTDVPGCHHVVDHNHNGLLCRLKDSDDLASKMSQMANFDDDVLKTLGLNGRRKMEEEFDEKIVISKYLNALQSVKVTA